MLDLLQSARADRPLEFGHFVGAVDVGLQEMTARSQHAPHLAEESVDRGIAVRRFDVEHGVKGRIGDR